MNRLSRLIACSIIAALPAFALAQGSPGQMGGGGMMNPEQMQQMNENMSRMQGMMQEMRNAESDAERERIRMQHMESMQKHMDMMGGGMMGQGMMGHGQGMMGQNQGMMNNQSKKQTGANQEGRAGAGMSNDQRLEMMENRMNQMQLMMEQMLQHQGQQSR